MKTMKRLAIVLLSLWSILPAAYGQSSSQMTINIDNPAFRKLVVAIPKIQVAGQVQSPQGKKLAEEGSQELIRLLQFSGFFSALAEGAYSGAWDQFAKARKTTESTAWITDSKGLSGEELVQWRALGVESLTMGALSEEPGKGLTLSFKTFDVNRSKEILAKQFTHITDYKASIRQYADFLLEAYTGKSGIFNSKIAFVGRRSKASAKQIFIADFDGSNITQITDGNTPHLSPSWSADGRYLVYTSYESRSPDLYIYDTQTRTKRRVTTSPGLDSGGNFAPNGKIIAYTSSRGDDTDIFSITPAGTERKSLLEGSGLDVDPKFSPDGKWLAWVSGRFGNPHIFVAGLSWSGDTPKIVSDKRLTYSGWYNATPAWTPESDKIAFGGYDRDIDRWDIFIMNPDGTQLERLTLKSGDSENPSFSPNGQLIAFQSNRIGTSNTKGLNALWIMNRDGSNQQKLDVTGLYDAQTPAWSSNRKNP
jgi:TolB protein